ncbi:hypothetical protein DBP12_36240 [Streptomyces sp. CS014]|nr:hypothetical protein DBP12_36240 [Streptomyces sp. CS014]
MTRRVRRGRRTGLDLRAGGRHDGSLPGGGVSVRSSVFRGQRERAAASRASVTATRTATMYCETTLSIKGFSMVIGAHGCAGSLLDWVLYGTRAGTARPVGHRDIAGGNACRSVPVP